MRYEAFDGFSTEFVEQPKVTTTRVVHSDDCATILLRSIYDVTCPRCAQVNKAIQLKRRTVANGCTENEAANARALFERVCARFALSRAETIDRLYETFTNAPETRREEAVRRTVRRKRQRFAEREEL